MATSNISMTPELAEFVQAQVDSGQFKTTSEVHRAALLAMKHREEERQARLQRLRGEIQIGIDWLEGETGGELESVVELDDLLRESLESARQRLAGRGVKVAP